MSHQRQAATRALYDAHCSANVRDYRRTREHVLAAVPQAAFARALDAGCGTGVCSLALAERAGRVVAFDLSDGSLRTARRLAEGAGAERFTFAQGSLLQLPFRDAAFDLVWSWGVVHHTADPARALDELARVLRPGGTLVLALYWRTFLTPLHEAVRHGCLRLGAAGRRRAITAIGAAVRAAMAAGFRHQTRDDNPDVRAQVENWFFVPEKYFFTPRRAAALLAERGLTCELVDRRTGRFKSSSNFVVRGQKGTGTPPGSRAGERPDGPRDGGPAPRRRLELGPGRGYVEAPGGADAVKRQAKQAEWAEQWSVFYDDRVDLFLEWIHPFTLRDFEGKSVLDAGCGPGHHIATVAPRARRVVGVDLNTAAIARRHTQAHANVTVLEDDIAAMKLGEQFDIVYSIGVVHHTDDPAATVRNLADHVRPGGHLILWVYSHEGNFLNRTLVEFSKRHALQHLPRPALLALARGLTAALYFPVHTVYRLPLPRLPYYDYFGSFRRLPFRRNLQNVFDKLNAPRTAFLRRAEVAAWFPPDRFTDVHLSPYLGVSWRASGRKR